MNKITLNNTLPDIFATDKELSSQIWKRNVSFEKGKHYLIEANSGTGKSSLCSYLYGYRSDYSGDILFDSKDLRSFGTKDWDDIRCKHLSLLFQELCLFAELTAFENVKLKNNLTGYKTDAQIDQMFDLLGISNKRNALVGKMSWGQQQRVAAIRCLCQPFDFLILDEPISHLDDENASVMAKLLADEAQTQGAAIIATSIGKYLPLDYSEKLAL